jgi:hypothetical protein
MLYIYSYFSGICNNFKARDGTKLETNVCYFVKLKQNLLRSVVTVFRIRIRIDLALLILEPFWESGSESRSKEIVKLTKIKKKT